MIEQVQAPLQEYDDTVMEVDTTVEQLPVPEYADTVVEADTTV